MTKACSVFEVCFCCFASVDSNGSFHLVFGLMRLCLIWMYRNTPGSPWGNFHWGACFCVCWWKPGQGSFTCLRTPPSHLEGFGSEPEPQTLFGRCMSPQSQGCEPPPWGTPTLACCLLIQAAPYWRGFCCVSQALWPWLPGTILASGILALVSGCRTQKPSCTGLWGAPLPAGLAQLLIVCLFSSPSVRPPGSPRLCHVWVPKGGSLVTHEARISCLVLLFKLRNIHIHTWRYVCIFRILVGLSHHCDFQWG